MQSTDEGRQSRRSRLVESKSGTWGSSSQDFVRLANLLYASSVRYSRHADGNCSIYTLCGIPVLFSALRCLLIELNDGMYGGAMNRANILRELAKPGNDITVILKHYPIPPELRHRLQLLLQIRHELTHPSHRPTGERSNTPVYLQPLRDERLLQSTEQESDHIWLAQLQSHKLFTWAFETMRDTVDILIREHAITGLASDGLRASYSEYETLDET